MPIVGFDAAAEARESGCSPLTLRQPDGGTFRLMWSTTLSGCGALLRVTVKSQVGAGG